jgi:hypothetical protein
MAEQSGELLLEHEWIGTKIKVTARWQGEPVYMHTFDPASAGARQRFVNAVTDKLPQADVKALERELLHVADSLKTEPGAATRQDAAAEPLAEMPANIRAEAEAMLMDPLLIQRVVDDVAALNVAGEKDLTATVYLFGVSRLLDRPLAGILQGPSSSGKSHLIEKTASLFPPETTVYATQMTPQALFHMRPGALIHKFIVAGERSRIKDDERAEATRALREMLSAGKLTKLMPVKVEGGRIETLKIEQDGPIAYVESTTMSKVFDEDGNRCIMLHTDERSEQTRRVVRQLAAVYSNVYGPGATDQVILRHHALQRMLQPLPVVVPFAERLGELMPTDRVEVRRAFPHLISMIQAITLLHQKQRERTTQGALIARADDYQLAEYLLRKPMARLLGGGISDPVRRFFERLKKWATGEFTTREVKQHEQASKSAFSGWLAELHDGGLVELVQARRGQTPATWRLIDRPHAADRGELPTVEQVFPDSTWTHARNAQMA